MQDSSEQKMSFSLKRSEALVIFEFLSRNWSKDKWDDESLVSDVAEKNALMILEGTLQEDLWEVLDREYMVEVMKARRVVVPNPEDWD